MATIVKRNGSYRITVSCGYSADGRQIRKSTTFTPGEKMTEKQIQRELDKFVKQFEQKCLMGAYVSGNVKFSVLADQWLEQEAKPKLKERTFYRYFQLRDRTYQAIGHIRIDKLNTMQIQSFINNLGEAGVNQANSEKGLSAKTIRHYHTFISDVMCYAIQLGMITDNPCRNVILPKLNRQEKDIYTIEEANEFLALIDKLEGDSLKYKVFFILAIYSGMRKGEILGLEWKDIDFDNCTIDIMRSSLYTPSTVTKSGKLSNQDKGIYTDTPKTRGSIRTLKLPGFIFDLLEEYRDWQNSQKAILGDQWNETDRLFTTFDGKPMSPSTPGNWLTKFQEQNNLRHVSIHSFRHMNASILINQSLDVKSISANLGHSNTSTTLDIYTHELTKANAKASEAISNALNFAPINNKNKYN